MSARIPTLRNNWQGPRVQPARSVPASRQGKRRLKTNCAAWRALRERILARDLGLCQECLRQGRERAGNEVDHKDGNCSTRHDDRDDNLETLCWTCHSRKTARENGGFGNTRRQANAP